MEDFWGRSSGRLSGHLELATGAQRPLRGLSERSREPRGGSRSIIILGVAVVAVEVAVAAVVAFVVVVMVVGVVGVGGRSVGVV